MHSRTDECRQTALALDWVSGSVACWNLLIICCVFAPLVHLGRKAPNWIWKRQHLFLPRPAVTESPWNHNIKHLSAVPTPRGRGGGGQDQYSTEAKDCKDTAGQWASGKTVGGGERRSRANGPTEVCERHQDQSSPPVRWSSAPHSKPGQLSHEVCTSDDLLWLFRLLAPRTRTEVRSHLSNFPHCLSSHTNGGSPTAALTALRQLWFTLFLL